MYCAAAWILGKNVVGDTAYIYKGCERGGLGPNDIEEGACVFEC